MGDELDQSTETPAATTTTETPASDDGFVVESASVAQTPSPVDTTARADTPTTEPVAAGDEDADEANSGAAAAQAPASTPSAKPKGKKQRSFDERVAKRRAELDRLTFEVREMERKREALRGSSPGPQSAVSRPDVGIGHPSGPTSQQPPAETAMPEPPRYQDFDTDEAYATAQTKWRADVTKWQADRETALKASIKSELDTTLKSHRTEAEQQHALEVIATTRAKVAQKYPDWNDKVTALKELRSSWYDRDRHGASETPFLTDLAASLLSQGRDVGGEVLYFLGSDLDRAQALADLKPSQPLRDALVTAPPDLIVPLLEHFASDEGASEFEELASMHPIECIRTVGALIARLSAASATPGSARPAPITRATPPAKPPAGAPVTRPGAKPDKAMSFDEWNAAEDARELAERKRRLGVA